MKHSDGSCLLFLFIAVLAIFYPVFYTEYLYTDEAPQLWFFASGTETMWIAQGRYVTYLLFRCLFGSIHSIHALGYARIFSLAGWMICLPAWYYIIKRVISQNRLPPTMVLPAMICLVSLPAFSIYIGWAACMEHFIACTAGLLSGYVLYAGLHWKEVNPNPFGLAIFFSILLGLLSLFTYQNGFGCFFLPFFIQFIAGKRFTRNIFVGVGCAFLIYCIYYLLFRYSLQLNGIAPSGRTNLLVNPFKKLLFFFGTALPSASHLAWIVNERSILGKLVCLLVFSGWLLLYFIREKSTDLRYKLVYLCGVTFLLLLIYLPSLLVAENYASNRTLFALDMAVFMLLAEPVFSLLRSRRAQSFAAVLLIVFFLTNAWYNFHRVFLQPVTTEFNLVKAFIIQQYKPDINTIYFIQPAENAFVERYGVAASWDEFGVPSTAKAWTPEPLVKQLIFEQTGNRTAAEKLSVKTWMGKQAFNRSGLAIQKGTMLIDVEEMLDKR